MSLTLDALFASPDHFLHSFEGDMAVFVPMDRAAYRASIFLDARIRPASDRVARVPLAPLLAHRAAKPSATAWIFHIAHCGSTLLARALDVPDAGLVLREPLALRQCAIAPDAARLRLTAAMCAKRYRTDAPTLVKANVPVNFILPDLAALDPGARAILLHLDWRDWLLAVLRDEGHRTWLRNVTGQLAAHVGDLSGKTDAIRAAALWLAQTRAFARATALLPNARVLDGETLFADPAPVLHAAAAHLGLPIGSAAIDAAVAGPLFATYSKNPAVAFDNAARIARRTALEQTLAPELDSAGAWLATQDVPDAALAAAALSR